MFISILIGTKVLEKDPFTQLVQIKTVLLSIISIHIKILATDSGISNNNAKVNFLINFNQTIKRTPLVTKKSASLFFL